MDSLIDKLCEGSDRQLDDKVKSRLRELKGKPPKEIKDELIKLRDECVYASLCSDFVIQVFTVMIEQLDEAGV